MFPFKLLTIILYLLNSASTLYQETAINALTDENFEKYVTGTSELWIVQFYSNTCKHCQDFVPEFSKAAQIMKNYIRFGVAETNHNPKLLNQFQIEVVPTVKFFGFKKDPIDYSGPRKAEDIIDTVLDILQSIAKESLGGDERFATELTDDNFEHLVKYSDQDWFIEFYAPWCVHCKKFRSIWEEVALTLKGKISVGSLDVSTHVKTANQYDVINLPSLFYFRNNHTHKEYPGVLSTNNIISWALEQYENALPSPKLYQLTSQADFDKHCMQNQLCVIAFLPELYICGQACRNNFIKIVKNGCEDYKKYSWGFLWTEAKQQPALEDSMDIGGSGYPELAVINPNKKSYIIFRGSFNEHSIQLFLEDITKGKGSTYTLKNQQIPPVKTVETWSGDDEILSEEDEILNILKEEL